MVLAYVDVDTEATQSVCSAHGVSCMPTIVAIKGKEQVSGVKRAGWGVDCAHIRA